MPVPTDINSLSTTPSANSPVGSTDSPSVLDDHQRQAYAHIATLRDTKANIASPALTGTPTAPTATAGTSTTQIATTDFATTADNLRLPKAGPVFTGTLVGPSASIKQITLGDNADASKNFVISVPAVANGTLTIEQQNGADVMTVAADGKVTFPAGMPISLNAPIIENGTSTFFDWVKFADGTAIIVYKHSGATTGTAYGTGGLYIHTLSGQGLPFPLIGAYSISGGGSDNGNRNWCSGNFVSGSLWDFSFWTTTQNVTVSQIRATIIGWWK